MNTYTINEVVQGKVVGLFIILGFRSIDGNQGVQLKAISNDLKQVGVGELWLPLDAIKPWAYGKGSK